MKIKLFTLALLLLSMFVITAPLIEPVYAYDPKNPLGDACNGVSDSPNCPAPTTKNPLTGPDGIILKIARFIAIIAGVAAVIVIVVSGIKYMLAGGDAKKAAEARGGLVGALIGLVIISLAGLIIMFVVQRL